MATNLSKLDDFFGNVKPSKKTSASGPTSLPTSPEAILKKAQELKIATNPLDIFEVVTRIYDIEIRKEDLGKSVSGFLERIGTKWCIYINQYESEFRQRFTVAHELAHFILHKDTYLSNGKSTPDLIFFRDSNTNIIEQEANDFAAKLLMPESSFVNAINSEINTLEKLSKKFQLSTSAVKYRAYKLGIISEY